jgi:uncharacterized protein
MTNPDPGGTRSSRDAFDTVTERPFGLELPDGELLRGEVRLPAPDARPSSAVVILHGFKGFRRWGFFPHLASRLARAGHAAVTFDFSLNGVGADGEGFDELDAFARNTLTREVGEAHRILDAAREGALPLDPPARLGLVGHSRGGGVAVIAAAEGKVDTLVTWASVATFDRWDDGVKADWRRTGRHLVRNARTGQDMPLNLTLLEDFEENRDRLDVEAAAARVRVPWLVVHGGADESVDVSDAHRLAAAASAAELAVVPGAGHTFGAVHPFVEAGAHLRAAIDRSIAHLEELPAAE